MRLNISNTIIIVITRFSCRRQGASADKLRVKAAKFLPSISKDKCVFCSPNAVKKCPAITESSNT